MWSATGQNLVVTPGATKEAKEQQQDIPSPAAAPWAGTGQDQPSPASHSHTSPPMAFLEPKGFGVVCFFWEVGNWLISALGRCWHMLSSKPWCPHPTFREIFSTGSSTTVTAGRLLVTQPRSHSETQQEAEAPLQPKLLQSDTSDLLLGKENHLEICLKLLIDIKHRFIFQNSNCSPDNLVLSFSK